MEEALPRLAGFTALKPGGRSFKTAGVAERCRHEGDLPQQPHGSLQLVVSPARYGSDLFSRYADNLSSRFAPATLQLNPADAERLGLQDGAEVTLDTESGSFSLQLCCVAGLASGCALVQNSASFPHLVPGGKPVFCQVAAGGSHD